MREILMKAKVLITDGSGRFKAGEVGEWTGVADMGIGKYDYCVDFSDGRRYYFYEGEIELIEEKK
jgi:hypothetical protein